MNTVIWLVAGGVLAWLAFSYFDFNRNRGLMIALVIGALGAYFGGSVIAPMMGQSAGGASGVVPFALVIAAATAAAFVVVGDMVYERFGV
jgi:uncharacterized membrane protein YeaQ/YmgE (transglycosylase-associated protein family)